MRRSQSANARRFDAIDWTRWTPRERATLVLTVRGGRVLLILKKRGLGAGKFNGPGGRIEAGETPRQAAIREVREELRITPTGLRPAGELRFQFADGHSIHAFVFAATGYRGHPQETDEAVPHWFPARALPYARMWADDRIWVPLLLARRRFDGRFLFDGDRMLGARIEARPGPRFFRGRCRSHCG
jgi:8-oxo-dGTP diphosphatase